MDLLELSQNDYGTAVTYTLYRSDDSTTAENLTAASSVSLDITRLNETPIVDGATVTVSDATNGEVQFTPEAGWFTSSVLDGRSHYVAIFKIVYATGQKSSFKCPVFIHQH